MAENKAVLMGYFGGDKTHCLSAWQSTGIEFDYTRSINSRADLLFSETAKTKQKSPQELLAMLAKEGHHTPFEKSALHFQITADLATHIHFLKHRIGVSINSECLTGDAIITFVDINETSAPHLRVPLSELHEKWNTGRRHQSTEKDALYSRKRIQQRRLRVLDEATGAFTIGHIKDIWEKGLQDVYLVTLENGKQLKATENHPFYTKNGYRSISRGLSVGDLVGCNGVLATPTKSPWREKEFFADACFYTCREFADKNNIGIDVCRKWAKIHGVTFKPADRSAINKGCKPWNKGDKDARNVDGKPWTFKDFFAEAFRYTRVEFAELTGVNYSTVKKWGYIYGIEFKKDLNKDFKKGNTPWNQGVTGYKINISPEGLEKRKHSVKRGKDSHFWKGGITPERALIGEWTRKNARKVHQKYQWTCQYCNKGASNPHAHHIIPVTTDISKAYDFNNLITVCASCHSQIHSSPENEIAFAQKVMAIDFTPSVYDWTANRKERKGNVLSVHFSPIVSIIYVGKEMTYDIEVDGINNNFIANGIVVHNSARYKELKDQWYIPEDWQGQDVIWLNNMVDKSEWDGRDAAYSFVGRNDDWATVLNDYVNLGHELYHVAVAQLTPILGRKRAKESARYFLPYAKQLDFDCQFNFRSFMHFQSLRNSEHAQKEVRAIARSMLEQVRNIPGNPFKYSLEAFGY